MVIHYIVQVFFNVYIWICETMDTIEQWRSHGAYQKHQPLNLVEQQRWRNEHKLRSPLASSWLKIPHSLEEPQWLVYQKLQDPYHANDKPNILILAWAPKILTLENYILFPPETLKQLKQSEELECPQLPKFPESFGPPTSFRCRHLSGCIFQTPLISGMQGWVWFYRSYYHTGGRIHVLRSEAPKVTYWTPDESDSENLQVDYVLN